MARATFFRVLDPPADEKDHALLQAIRGAQPQACFAEEPRDFSTVPGSPFAYWVSAKVTRLFAELPKTEGDGRTIRVGLQTADDFRFVRASWETDPRAVLGAGGWPDAREKFGVFQAWCRRSTFEGKRWAPFAKGGSYSPFYADIHLLVDWASDGAAIKGFVDPATGKTRSRPQNADFYFRPGLTWSDRTSTVFAPRELPAGVIISVKGSGGFAESTGELYEMLGALQSVAFTKLMDLLLGTSSIAKSYQVGTIGAVPFPRDPSGGLAQRARKVHYLRRATDQGNEVAHAFSLPGLAMHTDRKGTLEAIGAVLNQAAAEAEQRRTDLQAEIEEIVWRL